MFAVIKNMGGYQSVKREEAPADEEVTKERDDSSS